MKRIELSNEQTQEIISLYTEENIGRRKVAEKVGLKPGVVVRVLKENNIPMTNTQRIYKCNENTFNKIDNEFKAYWLGFLYADGCISRNTLILRLSSKDELHLEKFKNFLESDAIIKKGKQNSFGINTEYVEIRINSKKIVQDLINLNCYYCKSLILIFPSSSIVPSELLNHFVRGYFDGDGSISLTKEDQYTVSFQGTEDFLNNLKNIFNINVKLEKRKETSKVYYIRFGGNLQVIEKLNWLYNNANIYLERKYDRYNELLNKYPKTLIEERKKYSSRL